MTPPLAIAAVVAAAFLFLPPAAPVAAAGLPPDAEAAVPAAPAVAGLLVDVTGAVARPGLYRLQRGERVYAAIAAAGGLTAEADPSRLPDMAGALRDGQQVRVPVLRGRATASRAGALDLNSASAAELAAVPGFTPELAAAAVEYRTHFGGFQNVRELVSELGMGAAEFALARAHVRT